MKRKWSKNHPRDKGKPTDIPFTWEMREIRGEKVLVRVYPPAYAKGDKEEKKRLGFKPGDL